MGFLRPSLPWCFPIQQQPAAGRSRQQQAAAGAAKFQFYSRVSEVTLGPFLGFHCYVFALSDVFRKGCLAVCFLLWRLFNCSSTTAAAGAATSSSTSSRQQQAASSFCQQHAAAGSSRQQPAAASSRQQQAGAGSSRQQQAAGSSRQRQAAAKFQFYSRVSEVTLGPFWGSAFNAAARLRMAAWTVAT